MGPIRRRDGPWRFEAERGPEASTDYDFQFLVSPASAKLMAVHLATPSTASGGRSSAVPEGIRGLGAGASTGRSEVDLGLPADDDHLRLYRSAAAFETHDHRQPP